MLRIPASKLAMLFLKVMKLSILYFNRLREGKEMYIGNVHIFSEVGLSRVHHRYFAGNGSLVINVLT